MRSHDRLVGRERELEELAQILAAAKAGNGGMLLVAGEAGVGKTRLAEAAIAASGLRVLRGVAPQRGGAPYAPIATALRDHLRDQPGGLDVGPLKTHLGAVLPELGAAPVDADRESLVEAIRLAFESVGRTGATVVFLDDLHWADAATLELLPLLAGAAEEWPLLLLGAYRTDEIPRGHPLRQLRIELRRAGRLHELAVEPLDAGGTAELAGQVLGAELSPTLRAALHDRTQGVPFLVVELAAGLEPGSLVVAGKRGLELKAGTTVPLPETVRDIVRLRAEGLSADGRASVEAASVIGVRVDLELLASLDREAGLDEVIERGLLEEAEPGVATFRHDLTREALYADTPWPRRRALHRSVADLLETRGAEPRVVADHWLAAREPARARPRLLDAARRFCEIHAYRDSAAAARTALELWPEDEDESGRLAVLEELGRCAELCGELSEAQRALEEVAAGLETPRDLRRRAELMRRLATVYELQKTWPTAAAAHTEAADAFEQAGLQAEASTEWRRAGDAEEDVAVAMGFFERARESARRAGRADLESGALWVLGFWTVSTGRTDEGLELVRDALSLALAGHHVDVALDAYWALGALANQQGDYPGAQSAFEDALDYCRAHDRQPMEQFCVSCLGIVLLNRGEWDRAEALSREVEASPDASDHARIHALLVLGLVAGMRGSRRKGRSFLVAALSLARETGIVGSIRHSIAGLALLDELDGVSSPRWRDLVESAPPFMIQSRAPALRLASIFAGRRGDKELAHACAAALATWTSSFGTADARAALAHALGEVALLEGDAARAADHFGQALDRMADLDAPFERALTQMRAGVAVAAAGERELGIDHLVGAYHTFRKLGARPIASLVAADLEALGERVDRRLGRVAARRLERAGLTRRELEVLRLVAVGRTNKEIARELFLSPRTVDMHVRHVLAKLDCRSRTEATAKAHELGLLERAGAR